MSRVFRCETIVLLKSIFLLLQNCGKLRKQILKDISKELFSVPIRHNKKKKRRKGVEKSYNTLQHYYNIIIHFVKLKTQNLSLSNVFILLLRELNGRERERGRKRESFFLNCN